MLGNMNILVFQHIAIEHPGSFRDVMAAQGHTMHAIELDEGETIPPLDHFDALLVMGGPMDVWEEDKHPWLVAEKAAIRAWVSAGRPYLGMCLGEQLLAVAAQRHADHARGGDEARLQPAARVAELDLLGGAGHRE